MTALARGWFAIALWKRVLGGLVLGIALAFVAPDATPWVAWMGDLFVRLIRMLVVPVVFVSIASGVTTLADPRRLGAVGGRTVALFAGTTFVAVAIGMALGLLIHPGAGADLDGVAAHVLGNPVPVRDQLLGIVPTNIVTALGKGDMLGIIFFALVFGFATVLAGEEAAPVARVLHATTRVLFHLVGLVMEFTPFGVFALICGAVAQNGVAVFANVGLLALCTVLGVIAQILLVHVPLLVFVVRRHAVRFYRAALDALLVAFSTASSAATLPVALRIALDEMEIEEGVASTVLPIGASIGKDGTAMYVGLLSVFALQALNVAPDVPMLAIMLLTGALAAFGTAPIPSASLFMLAAVLASVGVGGQETALVVGFVLPFDRLLDMTRTVASASANLTVTATVDKWTRRPSIPAGENRAKNGRALWL